MSSTFTGSLDNFTTSLAAGQIHTSALQNNLNDAVNKVETEVRTLTFNVKHYGATGNGTTNDSAAIQAAIDAAEAAAGGTVYFPPGTYKITSGLTVEAAGVRLVGAGRMASVISSSLSAGGKMLTLGDGTNVLTHIEVRDLGFTGSANANYGVWLNTNATRYSLRDLRVTGCTGTPGAAIGMDTGGSNAHHSGLIERCELSSNDTGIEVRERSQLTIIRDCLIFNNNDFGIDALGDPTTIAGGRLYIENCQVEKNGTVADTTGSIRLRGVDVVKIDGLYNEQDTSYPGFSILCDQDASAVGCTEIVLESAYLLGNTQATKGVIVKYVDGFTIRNSRILNFTTATVSFEPGAVTRVSEYENNYNNASQRLFMGPVDPRLPASNAVIDTTVAYLSAFTVDRVTRVSSSALSVATQAGNVDLGIYDDTGARLGSTGSTAVGAAGRQPIALTATVTLRPGVKYWAAIQGNNAAAAFHYVALSTQGLAAGVPLNVQVTNTFPLPASLTIGSSAISRAYFSVFS